MCARAMTKSKRTHKLSDEKKKKNEISINPSFKLPHYNNFIFPRRFPRSSSAFPWRFSVQKEEKKKTKTTYKMKRNLYCTQRIAPLSLCLVNEWRKQKHKYIYTTINIGCTRSGRTYWFQHVYTRVTQISYYERCIEKICTKIEYLFSACGSLETFSPAPCLIFFFYLPSRLFFLVLFPSVWVLFGSFGECTVIYGFSVYVLGFHFA